ncbi:MAG: hypothetical protein ACR2P0_14395 [Acidimicrobiales bacterium]
MFLAQNSDFENEFKEYLQDAGQQSLEYYLIMAIGISVMVYLIVKIIK